MPRPRISILTTLLLMTILGMGIATFQQWRELRTLRVEVRQLRDETGRLSIENPNELHAIGVRANEPLVRKWRIWVPAGAKAELGAQWGGVPRTGVPANVHKDEFEAGEHWIEMRVKQNQKDGSWYAQLSAKGWTHPIWIKPEDCWWNWTSEGFYEEGVNETTGMQTNRNEPFIIARHRAQESGNLSALQKDDKPSSGFIVWLERK